MGYDFDWASLARAWPVLQQGLQMTALLVAVGLVSGIALGTLLAIVRTFGPRPLAWVAGGYVNLFRSIPLILTILWFYLPSRRGLAETVGRAVPRYRDARKVSISCDVLRAVRMTPMSVADASPVQSP